MCASAQSPPRAVPTLAHVSGTALPRRDALTTTLDPRTNHLLAALPEADWKRWLPLLELQA